MRRGDTIGNYVLVRPLDDGGHATVYLAEHQHFTNREVAISQVAIKILKLHAEPKLRDDLARRMLAEALLLVQLRHENVVRAYDAATLPDGRPYMVMEYLRGESLKKVIERTRTEDGPLPLGVALDIARQLIAGLAEAHRHGVVHRDVKPANIFYSRQRDSNLVKLLDFGVALIPGAARQTGRTEALGTIAYMAPELLHSQPASALSDLYGFGLVLYELLCGRGPFAHLVAALPEDRRIMGLADFHRSTLPPPPTHFRPDCPPDLEALVLQLLEKNPTIRPQHAPLVAKAINAILNRVEDAMTSSLSLLDRTEPTPIANRFIQLSATTEPPMPAFSAAPQAPATPTPHDPTTHHPVTVRLAVPAERGDAAIITDPVPDQPRHQSAVTTAPYAPPQAQALPSIANTLPGPPPSPGAATARRSVTTRMPHATAAALLSRSDMPASFAAPTLLAAHEDAPVSAAQPTNTAHPTGAGTPRFSRSSDKPTVAFDPNELARNAELHRPPSRPDTAPPLTDRTAPSGLVVPHPPRGLAHLAQNRRTRLALASTALALLAVAGLWFAQPSRFAQQQPPSWLAAPHEAVPLPSTSVSAPAPSTAPRPSQLASTDAPIAPPVPSVAPSSSASAAPPARSPMPRQPPIQHHPVALPGGDALHQLEDSQ